VSESLLCLDSDQGIVESKGSDQAGIGEEDLSMLLTITNTSGAILEDIPAPVNGDLAIGASWGPRGITENDLVHGHEKGAAMFQALESLRKRGLISVTLATDPYGASILPSDWFVVGSHGATHAAAGSDPNLHAADHQNGGGDEISVAGLSGLLADAQTPAAHAADHQNGGADEISVAGLSGLLADAQTPAAHAADHQPGGADQLIHGAEHLAAGGDPNLHAADHENGGGDEIDVTGLSGLLADGQTPLAHEASHLPGGADPQQSTAIAVVINAEVADVINIEVDSPVVSVEQYEAIIMPQTTMEPTTASFTLSEAGPGAEITPAARCRIVFTTDATGEATLAANDVAGASGETCSVIIRPLFTTGDTAEICAPVHCEITFD